jgi:hypothetical protein
MSHIQTSSLYENKPRGKGHRQNRELRSKMRTTSAKMPKLHHGVGANCTVLTKFIHPSEHVRNKHANLEKGHKTVVLLLGEETFKVNRKEQKCYTFRSDDYPNIILYAVTRYVNVVTEGPTESLFCEPRGSGTTTPEATIVEDPVMPPRTNDHLEEIQNFTAMGAIVDDDNLPAPENVPTPNEPTNRPGASNAVFPEDGWGFQGTCPRKSNNHANRGASISEPREIWGSMYKLDYWMLFFPVTFCKTTMLPAMNKKLDRGRPPIEWWEYLRWLGLWHLLATTDGHDRRSFWSTNNTDDPRFKGAPFRLNDLMSRTRFEEILDVSTYFDLPYPAFKDDFHPIRQLVKAWNDNMLVVFIAAWIVCLDESMSLWTNMWTCPGFVFCPRKPWDTGNEYHTIACGITSIIFYMEMVEGKGRNKDLGKMEFEELGKTVGLLLRMTQHIWNTGRVVILDSGFCVLSGIVELAKRGLHGGALIKKRRYWPKWILGEAIKAHFAEKKVGEVDCWNGSLNDQAVTVFCFKEPDYIMSIMSTYGTVNPVGKFKRRVFPSGAGDGTQEACTFQYTEVFHNHYQYRHVVDDNNNNRMQPISLEETWKTSYWPNRVFAFILGVTGVNTQRAYEHFGGHPSQSNLEFRRELSWDMIWNPDVPVEPAVRPKGKERTCNNRKKGHCELTTLPKYCAFDAHEPTKFAKTTAEYNQRRCVCGKGRTRTYCNCSPGIHRCYECYAEHRSEVALANAAV